MSPPPIPRMSKNEARGNQRQSEAISFLSYRGHQRPSDAIRPHLRCNQTQSDAIRRNQTQSDAISMPGALLFSVFSCFGRAARACVLCFCVWGRHNGPVCVVVVFGRHNGSTGLCFVFSCFGRPPFTSLKTQHGVNFLPYKT